MYLTAPSLDAEFWLVQKNSNQTLGLCWQHFWTAGAEWRAAARNLAPQSQLAGQEESINNHGSARFVYVFERATLQRYYFSNNGTLTKQ